MKRQKTSAVLMLVMLCIFGLLSVLPCASEITKYDMLLEPDSDGLTWAAVNASSVHYFACFKCYKYDTSIKDIIAMDTFSLEGDGAIFHIEESPQYYIIHKSSVPGVFPVSVTATSYGEVCGGQSLTIFLGPAIVVAPTPIEGPDSCCAGETVLFRSGANPANHMDENNNLIWHTSMIHWYVQQLDSFGNPGPRVSRGYSITQDEPDISKAAITFPAPGEYLVTARTEGGGPWYRSYIDEDPGWDGAVTKKITVTPFPPPCVDTPCDGSGGGGCSSCGGGSGAPSPNMSEKTVHLNSVFNAPMLGPGGQSDGATCNGVCPQREVETRTCGSQSVTYIKLCGKCREAIFHSPAQLGNGNTVTNNGNGSYTLQDSGGNTTQFVQVPGTNASRISSETDADGNATIYNRNSDGAITSVTQPDGTTWTYTHDIGDKKIKTATAPDGTRTEMEYVQSGWAQDQVSSSKTYDAGNNLLSETSLTYYENGNLYTYTENGKTTSYTYGTDTITVTDESASPQKVTVYQYGADTTTVTRKHSTDPAKDQATTTKYYMKDGYKTYTYQTTDTGGNTTTYSTYIPTGTDTDGKVEHEDYEITDNVNLTGKVYRITNPQGQETNYTYDSINGNLLTVEYPDNSTEEYTYYPGTTYTYTVKNTRGNYTRYNRDTANMNRVLSVQTSDSTQSTWTTIKETEYYPLSDPHGKGGKIYKERIPSIDGTTPNEKTYEYYETVNGAEKLRESPTSTYYQHWNGTAYETKCDHTTYDDMGRVLSTTDANGKTIIYTYDAKGRQTSTIYNTSPEVATESVYDCCTLTRTTDEEGRETHYAYDGAKRLTDTWTNIPGQSSTTPLVHYTYDSFGNQSTVTTRSAASTTRTTAYTYDNSNRVTRIDYPSPLGYEEYGYNTAGNMQWKRDGSGAITLYKYDNLNRLTNTYYNYTGSLETITYPATADVTYAYEGGTSLKTTMTDTAGTSTYAYDAQDRLLTYTPPKPAGHAAITYTYNNMGQKTGISTTGYNVTYTYYAGGQLKSVNLSGTPIAAYTYDAVGNRTRVDYGNGTWQTYTYDQDPRYRLATINYAYRCDPQSPVEERGGLQTTRDKTGNPTYWGDLDRIYTRAYTYDLNSRLATENYPGQPQVTNTYDWVGNKTSLPGSEYNAADQLTTMTGHTYAYDGRGNMTSDNGTSYTYTPANLLATAGSSSMTWDAAGNRITFTSSTDTSNPYTFVYDPTAGIPAIIEEAHAGTSTYYVREPGGALIARVSGIDIKYYGFDDLGSTLFLTDSTGIVTDKYTYDAWGNSTSHTGSTQQPYRYVGRLGYYSHYQDSSFSPLQLGVRFYNRVDGRFGQRDPIKNNGNHYFYVQNRPTWLSDPDGRIAGRYREICNSDCSRKGLCGKIQCWLCKKIVDKTCSLGRDECCTADKGACTNDCDKRYTSNDARIACYATCSALYDKCLLDGKAFELP